MAVKKNRLKLAIDIKTQVVNKVNFINKQMEFNAFKFK